MVATTFFLDSRFTVWTRLCRALDFADALRYAGIMVASFIEFVTRQTFVPFPLVFAASFKVAVFASNLGGFTRGVKLTTTTIWTGTPEPVLVSLLFNLQYVRIVKVRMPAAFSTYVLDHGNQISADVPWQNRLSILRFDLLPT